MSRIGKLPIKLPKGVDVKIEPGSIEVKGPKGSLSRVVPASVSVRAEDGALHVSRANDERQNRALHGLMRALIANMVKGVSEGFRKNLEIIGVGYRAAVEGKTLRLDLGYSHPIHYPFPAGIDIKVEKNTLVSIEGIDNELVGQTAAEIRRFRKPEPYKGKGVRYAGEIIRLKVGKKNV
ncbi:MAG: 50S ribosomal protein L6 [Candidatus Omnitrophica bacterium]|nr:50S ribosomal protein L6 [bacterium]NUN97472.1 50S ribosomal protein L6 [Candidatus Omnitrophota bacterium]